MTLVSLGAVASTFIGVIDGYTAWIGFDGDRLGISLAVDG